VLLAVTNVAVGQAQRPRTADYEFVASANDARAIWVNPAGLAANPEASVMGDLTIEWQLEDKTRVSQWMLGFNSHGLGFAYQRDRFPDDPLTPENDPRSVSAFRFATSLPFRRGALGGSFSLYRGGDAGNETGWDIGLRFNMGTKVALAGVLRNIGRPVPFDVPLPFGGAVGFAWLPVPAVLELSVDVELAERPGISGVDALYRGGVGFSPSADIPFTVHTALALSNSFALDQWVIGVSFGGGARGVVLTSGPLESANPAFDRFTLGGVVSRAMTHPRP
jgi:hypothetical protein